MLTFRNTVGLVLAAALAFVMPGCQSAEQEIGTGEFVGRTYTHDYFDLKLKIPTKWHVLTRKQMKKAAKAGRKLSGGFGGSSRRGVMLLCASRLPMNKPLRRGQFNHNLIIAAEKAGTFSRVETGAEYLERVGELLERNSRIGVKLGPIEHNRKIGHFNMDSRGVTMTIGKHTCRQRYYAVRVDDYFLFIIATFQNGPQFRELQQLIAAIR